MARKNRGIRSRQRPPEPEKSLEQTQADFYKEFQHRKVKIWEFYGPIFRILLKSPDERLPSDKCLEQIHRMVYDRLSHVDYELMKNKEPRWKAQARFAVRELKDAGYLLETVPKGPAPRGVWALD